MRADGPGEPDLRTHPPTGDPVTGPDPGAVDAAIPRGTTVWSGVATVHFDGAFQRVRGRKLAAYGFTVDGELRHEEFGLAVPPDSERATNNVAEYCGAIAALEWIRRQRFRGAVVVLGDSQLIIEQMRGEYEVRSDRLRPYHEHLQRLVAELGEVRFDWIPREENARADALSKRGIAEAAEGRSAGPAPVPD